MRTRPLLKGVVMDISFYLNLGNCMFTISNFLCMLALLVRNIINHSERVMTDSAGWYIFNFDTNIQ